MPISRQMSPTFLPASTWRMERRIFSSLSRFLGIRVAPAGGLKSPAVSFSGFGSQERRSDVQAVVAPLLLSCATTVSELHAFQSLELLFERKQIPRIVVNFSSLRKTTEPLEITRVPWAQG